MGHTSSISGVFVQAISYFGKKRKINTPVNYDLLIQTVPMSQGQFKYVPLAILEGIPLKYENVWCFNYKHMMRCLEFAHIFSKTAVIRERTQIVSDFIHCLRNPTLPVFAHMRADEKASWSVKKPKLEIMVMQYIWEDQKENFSLLKVDNGGFSGMTGETTESAMWTHVQHENTTYLFSDIEKEFDVLCEMRNMAVDNNIGGMGAFPRC